MPLRSTVFVVLFLGLVDDVSAAGKDALHWQREATLERDVHTAFNNVVNERVAKGVRFPAAIKELDAALKRDKLNHYLAGGNEKSWNSMEVLLAAERVLEQYKTKNNLHHRQKRKSKTPRTYIRKPTPPPTFHHEQYHQQEHHHHHIEEHKPKGDPRFSATPWTNHHH